MFGLFKKDTSKQLTGDKLLKYVVAVGFVFTAVFSTLLLVGHLMISHLDGTWNKIIGFIIWMIAIYLFYAVQKLLFRLIK